MATFNLHFIIDLIATADGRRTHRGGGHLLGSGALLVVEESDDEMFASKSISHIELNSLKIDQAELL